MSALPTDRHALASLEALLAPSPYRPLSLLGRGGAGSVFLVEHRQLRAHFALKVVHREHAVRPDFVQRLRLEARALGHIEHPNVVDVVDLWFAGDGTPCLVLELLTGRTLAEELLTRGRLPVEESLRLASDALSGLGAAHAVGLVHRDVKPANFFLHREADRSHCLKLLDFGLARVTPDAPLNAPTGLTGVRTTTGALVGSHRYMSPEALRGEKLDRRADIYGVGLILYEMLVGHGPFDFSSTVTPPSQLVNVQGFERLDSLVSRALEFDPSSRFQNAEEFLEHLRTARIRRGR